MSDYWVQITVHACDTARELMENFFFENGSCGIEEKENVIEGYFEPSAVKSVLESNIREYAVQLEESGFQVGEIKVSECPKSDWASKWRESFKPVEISSKLIVKPPWEDIEPEQDQTIIEIMPKMAFGTGTHETTQLCLKMQLVGH